MNGPHFVIAPKTEQPNAPAHVKISPPASQQAPEVKTADAAAGPNLARMVRRSAAIAIVLAALWWLAFPAFYAVSNHAVLNVRTAQIRAPIDGIAYKLHHDIGDHIATNTLLADLVGQDVTKSHLAALQTRRSEITAKIKRLTFVLKELKPAAASSQARQLSYRDALVANLEAAIQEAQAKLELAKISYDVSLKRLERMEILRKRSSVSLNEYDDATEHTHQTKQRIAVEEFNLTKFSASLRAAREDAYVTETPYFHQRAEELTLRVPELEAELTELNELIVAVDLEMAQEKRRVDQQRTATVKSPMAGVVWTRHGNPGQMVKQNEVLYDIAADSTIFVEAFLHQRHLASVGPGCRATINLTGGRSLCGKVRAVRTIGPVDNEPSYALKMADSDLKQVRVLIDFDDMPDDAAHLIGRHVGVLITSEETAWHDRVAIFLFRNLRI